MVSRAAIPRRWFIIFVIALANACGGQASGSTSAGDASVGSGGSAGSAVVCPSLKFEFAPRSLDAQRADAGVTVEPLQVPSFGGDATYYGPSRPDPSTWDRSPLPAGACVFRLHGVNPACFPMGGSLWPYHCAELESDSEPRVLPLCFYEEYGCHLAPGCPASLPGTSQPGHWWYLSPVSESETDLVICAPECAEAYSSVACLVLNDSRDRCR